MAEDSSAAAFVLQMRTRRRAGTRRRVLTSPTLSEVRMANSRLCSIPDCGKPHKGRGYCQAHLVRLRKKGSPMDHVPVREMGKTERFIEEVSREPDTDQCIEWPYAKDAVGRGWGRYRGRHILASRAVCIEAHGSPPTDLHEAAHSCGNGHMGCVNPHHLRWATRKENEADKLMHGTRLRGEHVKNFVLTDIQCAEIRSLRGKLPQSKIAKMYGVTQQHICAVQIGRFRAEPTPRGD